MGDTCGSITTAPRLLVQDKTGLLRNKAQERPLELLSAHVWLSRSVIPIARSKSSSEVELLMFGLGVKDYFFSRLELCDQFDSKINVWL